MNKTIVFRIIWRYVKFLIAFILLLGSINVLYFVFMFLSPYNYLEIRSPITLDSAYILSDYDFTSRFEQEIQEIMKNNPTPIERKATFMITPSKINLNVEFSVDADSKLANYLLQRNGEAGIYYRQPMVSGRRLYWLFGGFSVGNSTWTGNGDVTWSDPLWSLNSKTNKVTLSVMLTVVPIRSQKYAYVSWSNTARYETKDEMHVLFKDAIFRAAWPSPSIITPNEIVFLDGASAVFELLPEKPSLIRREFIRKLGDIHIPILSPLFYAMVELLPLIILAGVAGGALASKIKIPVELKQLTVWLLSIHFLLYFLVIHNDLYRQYLIHWFHFDNLNNLRMFFDWNWDGSRPEGAFIPVMVSVLGVLLPLGYLHKENENTQEQNTKLIQRFSPVLDILFISGIIVFGYYCLHFLTTKTAVWQCSAISTNFLVNWLQCDIPSWVTLPLIFFVATLFMRWTIPHLTVILWNRNISSNTSWIATFVSLYIIIYSTILPIGFNPAITVTEFLWLGFNITLGALLLYQFFMAFLYQAHEMKMPINLKSIIPWILALALFFSIPAYYGDKAAQALSYPDDIINLAFALDNIFIYFWVAAILWLLYQDGKTDLSLNKNTRWIGALGAASVLFNITARWMYIPATFLFGWLALSWLMRRAHWEERHNLDHIFKQIVQARAVMIQKINMLRTAEHTLGALQKKKREKVAAGDEDFIKARKSIEKHAASIDRLRKEPIKGVDRDFKHLPLAFGPKNTAWENGLHGAKWACLIALPWLVVAFISFMQETSFSHAYLLDSVDSILSILTFWSGIGFVMGYFFPYLRGDSGLQKGVRLALALILPTIPLHIIQYQTFANWQGFFLWAFQVFAVCILLGLFAFDYLTIRGTGKNWETILEIHGLFPVGVWTSGVVAGLSAAIINWFINPAQMQIWLSSAAQIVLPIISQADTFFK